MVTGCRVRLPAHVSRQSRDGTAQCRQQVLVSLPGLASPTAIEAATPSTREPVARDRCLVTAIGLTAHRALQQRQRPARSITRVAAASVRRSAANRAESASAMPMSAASGRWTSATMRRRDACRSTISGIAPSARLSISVIVPPERAANTSAAWAIASVVGRGKLSSIACTSTAQPVSRNPSTMRRS